MKLNLIKIVGLALSLAVAAPAFASDYGVDWGIGHKKRWRIERGQQDRIILLSQYEGEGDGYGADESDYDDGGARLEIRPRQAAAIARDAYPGTRVLRVRLLPNGIYAVTLRGQGRLVRVMVDGRTGAIL
jgi:hypothetical protein